MEQMLTTIRLKILPYIHRICYWVGEQGRDYAVKSGYTCKIRLMTVFSPGLGRKTCILYMKGVVIMVIGLMISAGLVSCGGDEPPEGILSKKQMVRILSEIYLAEDKTTRLSLQRDSSLQVFDTLQSKIFKKMSTSDTVFKKSLDYYWNRPEEMEQIYEILIDSLNLREQRTSLPAAP